MEANSTQQDEEMRAGIGSGEMVLPLNKRQIDIIYHTMYRAAGGLYCGGGPDMDSLVAAGLMEYAGRKSCVPDPYYRLTSKGRTALREQNTSI